MSGATHFLGSVAVLASGLLLRAEAVQEATLLRPYGLGEGPSQTALPFFQALPFAQGEVKEAAAWKEAKEPARTVAKALAHWPDGSVKWLGVEGVWGKTSDGATEAPLTVTWDDRSIELRDAQKQLLFTFTPEAAYAPVRLPKEPQPADAEFLDREGQYAWAVPIASINAEGQTHALSPVVREGRIEEENSLFTLWLFRGMGGTDSVGRDLEWQLRVRCYHSLPLVRLQMTWKMRWNPERYALASAKLVISDGGSREGAEARGVIANPNGSARLLPGGAEENPPDALAILRPEGGAREWSIAVPDLLRLGPNHLLVTQKGVELASWTERTGLALDLRRSSNKGDDFGMRGVDLDSNGKGVARTTEASLVFGSDPEANRALAEWENRRNGLWFATAEDLERTQALGPFQRNVLSENADYFRALQANLHFLLVSRSHWRWFGFANFGDVRTNFAHGNNAERGLVAGRWALHGRYGWRNGSGGGVYDKMLKAGLFLDDRALLLAGLDYARHVADVDLQHGSFWTPPVGDDGGLHRRNRDHWSGSPQMQYSATRGLYLASWLGGGERLADGLAELRGYLLRSEQVPASSYAGQAWIFRYMETRKPEDLALAHKMLERAGDYWKETPEAKARGVSRLASIYFHNIRGHDEGVQTLAEFYEATGDKTYLDAICEIANADHKPPTPGLGEFYAVAYALGQEVPAERFDAHALRVAAETLQGFQPGDLSAADLSGYEALATFVREGMPPAGSPVYRESNAIGARSGYAFHVLRFFGNGSAFLPPVEPVKEEGSAGGEIPEEKP